MSTVQADPTAAVEQAIPGDPTLRIVGRSPWQLFWRRFRKDRMAFVGLGFIIALILAGVFAPLISKLVGHGPNQQFSKLMTNEFGLPLGPNKDFWFGADGSLVSMPCRPR